MEVDPGEGEVLDRDLDALADRGGSGSRLVVERQRLVDQAHLPETVGVALRCPGERSDVAETTIAFDSLEKDRPNLVDDCPVDPHRRGHVVVAARKEFAVLELAGKLEALEDPL